MAPSGSYPKGVARRAEILRVALEVFAEEGWAGTSLRTISKRCGISLAGLLHHFPTRDHLLTDILREVDDQAEAAYVEFGDAIDVGDYLAKVMDHNASEPARIRLYVALVAAATDPSHPAHVYFVERFERLRTVLSGLAEFQGSADEKPTLDPEFVARSLVAAADGIQNQWLYDDSIDMGAHVRRTWAVLTDH